MLAEGVVGHERARLGAVREHRVRPVHHGHRLEAQRLAAQIDNVVSTNRCDWSAISWPW